MNIIKNLKQWWKTLEENNQKAQYNNGFDWAAGRLLRKETTPYEIEYTTQNDPEDPFDTGAIAAIELLIELKIIIDNRY